MTCTNLPPRTGQQFSISHGDYHAVVTELGATLRKLTYQGEDIIVSPGPDDMVTCCHGQLLIPHREWRMHLRRQDLHAADRRA